MVRQLSTQTPFRQMDQSANQAEKDFEEEAHSKSQEKDKNWILLQVTSKFCFHSSLIIIFINRFIFENVMNIFFSVT